MTPLKRNLSRLLFLTLVITLGGAIFGVVYYLKMDRNEDTLNTLLFRELQQVEGTVQRSLEKVGATAKYSFPEEICGENKRVTRADCFFNSTVNDKQLEDVKTDIESNFEKLRNSSADLADIKVVGIEEVETKPGNKKEQYSFSFKIPQFNTVRFTQSKYYEKGDITLSIELESSIHYSLKQRANRFQTVALVAEGGEVKSVVNQVANLSNDAELLLRRVINLSTEPPSKDNCKPEPEDDTCSADKQRDTSVFAIEGTRFVDVSLSDSDYRAYIHPITSKGLSAENKQYYLVGVIKTSVINAQKLKLSPDLLMWLILALLLLIAVIPLIKLRFISANQTIQKGDKSQIVLGLIVAVGVITIGFSQQLFFDYLIDFKQLQLKQIHAKMKEEFNTELQTLLKSISEITKPTGYAECSTENRGDMKCVKPRDCNQPQAKITEWPYCQYTDHTIFTKNTDNDNQKYTAFIESISSVNEDGQVISSKDYPVLNVSQALSYTQKIDITDREYVKVGRNEQYWHYKKEASKKEEPYKLYLQRLFNIEDGRRNLMLALSPEINKKLQIKSEGDKTVNTTKMFIAGTRLPAFEDKVLPNQFGYAVIDDNGKVLFHSDDSLSLIENFFTETNHNSLLKIATEHKNAQSPTLLEADYKGEPHLLIVDSLVQHQNKVAGETAIPWQLIVFFNPRELQTNNMVLVFVAVFLFLLIIIPSFVMLRYITHQRFWQELCGFDKKRKYHYFMLGMLIFAASFFVQFQMGVVQSLFGRLSLWAVSCSVLVLFLARNFNLSLSYFFAWRRPTFSFSVLTVPLVLLLLFMPSGVHFQTISINSVYAYSGLVVLFVGIGGMTARRQFKKGWRYWKWFGCKKALPPNLKVVCVITIIAILTYAIWERSVFLIAFVILFYVLTKRWESQESTTKRDAIESTRFTAGYVLFLTGLAYLGAAIPATLIAYSAHDYLLQRQSHFEEASIAKSIASKKSAIEQYKTFLNQRVCTTEDNFFCNMRLELSVEESLAASFPPNQICGAGIKGSERCDTQWAQFISKGSYDGQNEEFTDNVFDVLFSSTPSETEFVSHLAYAAKQDLYIDKSVENRWKGGSSSDSEGELRYRTDLFMLKAVSKEAGQLTMLLMLLGLPLGLYLIIRQLIVKRLLGEHLQDQYRLKENCNGSNNYAYEFPKFERDVVPKRGHSILILNSTRLTAEQQLVELEYEQKLALYQSQVYRITDTLDKYYSSEKHRQDFYFLDGLGKALSDRSEKNIYVALSGLEQVSLNEDARKDALALLYELHLNPNIILILVAETAPLYRLLNPAAYDASASVAGPDVDEKSSWTKLFSEFEKHYVWSPLCKKRLENLFDINALFKHECQAWPEMVQFETRFDRQRCREPEQVIEFMLVHAGPLYRRKWEECTVKEKLILWKMAHGASINPESAVTIERLVRRCYLFRDKGWHIVNESFRQFILTAEPESVVKEWMDNISSGAWSVLRIPIFALLLVLLAIFVYSSGSSLNTLLSIATATLGLIPLLIKNFSLLRGGGTEIE